MIGYKETQSVYCYGNPIYSTGDLFGLAFLKYQTALLVDCNAILISKRTSTDPVLAGKSIYNMETGGWDDCSL